MRCPVCVEAQLVAKDIEPGLSALSCVSCCGVWLEAERYLNWIKEHPSGSATADSAVPVELASGEKGGLKFCPHCAYMLVKYKIGRDLSFAIERCGHCGGIWFDKNEWEILKQHNLDRHIHEVFSQEWQSHVRADQHKNAMREILMERLGEKDYVEFERVKRWLDEHPKTEELYALLIGSRMAERSAVPRKLFR